MSKQALHGRSNELKELADFAASKKAGFVYVRGRRRVGKSTILKELQRTHAHVFYFFGTADVTTRGLLNSFAEQWDKFTSTIQLTELKKLSWTRIFSEISTYLRKSKINLVLIFDEIQWIAKTKSGCIGAMKEAWLDWENLGVKVIVCGSSNKFFLKNTGTDEAILRGLKTRSDFWVHPFSLDQLKKYYFPKWKHEEIALTYMMLGGIPYYLNQIEEPHRGFIQCINDSIFTSDTIFLEEIDEVLRLEFRGHGLKTAKAILSCLGQNGTTQAEVQKTTGFSLTTVARALEQLSDYGLVFQKSPAHRKKQNHAGSLYFMKDFYLNFFFQVLLPYRAKIESNQSKGLLFPQVFENSNSNYFIQNFSGKAFELLIRYSLERKLSQDLKLYQLLLLRDHEYDVLFYWDRETEIDILVEHQKDRISRIIECKWVGPGNNESTHYIREVIKKKYTPPPSYSIRRYLCISKEPTPQLAAKAAESDVMLIGLGSLF